MGLFAKLGKWWRKRQRQIDRSILFNSIEEQGAGLWEENIQNAKLVHIINDSAWAYPEEWKDEEPELYEILVER